MTLLQPTDVPTRTGINNAITTEIAAHASVSNTASQHYDSGWITLPLTGAFTGVAGEVPQYRRVGKVVMLRGRLTGTLPVGTTVVANLPAGFIPSALTMWARAENSAANNGRMWVSTAGAVNVSPAAATTSTSVACTFFID